MTSPTGPSADPGPAPRPAGGRRPAGAFTLLELVLVLMLISLVLALAAPSLGRFGRGRDLAETANHMLALARLARSQAVAEARTWRLNIDPNERAYWLTVEDGGTFVRPARDWGRRFDLPEGAEVAVEGADRFDQVPSIAFRPDGRCDPVVVDLANGGGRRLRLRCPSPAEPLRIEIVQEETR